MDDEELARLREKRKNELMSHRRGIIHLTEYNFSQVMAEHQDIVIDFWAEWCGPCRNFGPVFEEVALEYPEVQFCKCDTDRNRSIASQLKITSIPFVMFIRDAAAVRMRAGSVSAESFRQELDLVFRNE
jgi:thioredoxin